jgi:hypothetical protein
LSSVVVNSNNKPWTLGKYLAGLRYEYFKLGKRNPEFEQDVREALPGITRGDLGRLRQELREMSRSLGIPGIEAEDQISLRELHHPFSHIKPYLQRGGATLDPEIYERVEGFCNSNSLPLLGYHGGEVHDYGHLLTGFKPSDRGEAQQVIFDMYFQHMLRGFMVNDTLALSLQSNFKLARLASHYMSLTHDSNTLAEMCNAINISSELPSLPKSTIDKLYKEYEHTHKLYEQVVKVLFNKWTFPKGYDMKLVDQSLQNIQSFLKRKELLSRSGEFHLFTLEEHWLKDEEVEDITNYAQFCALKCMGHLSALSPEEKNKTIQQVMDENGYFNMELLERSTGLGTDKELKLPTYEEWRKMLCDKPEINYNELITKATQSIKARR